MARVGLLIFVLVVGLLFLTLVLRLLLLFLNISLFAWQWRRLANKPVPPRAIRLAVLGDSTMQGIGASRLSKTAVGRIAKHIAAKTGRPVHIYNVSQTGARTEKILHEQLPHIASYKPDLILLSAGANDVIKLTPHREFMAHYRALINQLPAAKTVAADIPNISRPPVSVGLSAKWNPGLHALLHERGIRYALVYKMLKNIEHNPRTYAADFFHASNYGYRFWEKAFIPPIDAILAEQDLLE